MSMLDVENLLKKDDQKEKIEIYIGDDEQTKIDKFIEFVKTNFPKNAMIDNKDKENITITDYDGDIKSIESFYRTFTAYQLYKFTNAETEIITTQKDISNSVKETVNLQKDISDSLKDISSSIKETVDVQKDMKSRISRFSIYGEEILGTQEDIKNKIDKIEKDLKGYIDKKIEQLEDKMEIVKRP